MSSEATGRNSVAIPGRIEELSEFYTKLLPTGSRVICPDAVTKNSDEDYMVLVPLERLLDLENKLLTDGWIIGGSGSVGGHNTLLSNHTYTNGKIEMSYVFHSWKLDEFNLLVTCNEEYFDDFSRATFLAKALGLTKKSQRCILFKALTRDDWDFPERKPKKSVYEWKTFEIPVGEATATYAGTSAPPPIALTTIDEFDNWPLSDLEDEIETTIPTAV